MTAQTLEASDPRVAWPILTTSQVAALTEVSPTTIKGWTRGEHSIVHSLRNKRGRATIPFVGLVEAEVAGSLLHHQHSPARVRAVILALRLEHGAEFAVTAPHLVTDLTHTFLRENQDLTRIQDHQGAFYEVLRNDLRSLRIGRDGRVEAFTPARLDIASVDPRFNGGSLSITRTRTPVSAVVGSLLAGELVSVVAADYGLDLNEVARIEADLEWAQKAA